MRTPGHRPSWKILGFMLLAAGLFAGYHYVPFQWPPAVVDLGILVALAGLVSLLRPLRLFGIRSRPIGALVAAAGILLFAVGLLWPASTIRPTGTHQRIDDFMDEYAFYEQHETVVRATPEQVGRAVREVRLTDMPVAVALMRIRAMASGRFAAPPRSRRPLLDLFSTPGSGFLALDRTSPSEFVGGMVGRQWTSSRPPRLSTPEEYQAFNAPGYVKVAFNLRWTDAGNGFTRLTTETRCIGTDPDTTRIFGRYWRVIYPGSAVIRRVWLDAVAQLAERTSA